MKENPDNKAERVLMIYSKLKQGKIIYKSAMSGLYGVSERTIQRDITDIQNFLQSQFMETGNIQEIVFDKRAGGYRLQIRQSNALNGKAVLAVCKILLGSRALTGPEMLPIIYSLIALCDDDVEASDVKDVLYNEIQHYAEQQCGRELLDCLWDLEHAVKAHKCIEIRYKSLQNSEELIQKIKPVKMMYSGSYFYLAAYGGDADGEENVKTEDAFPLIYRVDRIREYTVTEEPFQIPYAGQFEGEEFRKRIPSGVR